jgi:hypothetical protein
VPGSGRSSEDIKQVAYLDAFQARMTHGCLRVDALAVSSPDAFDADVAALCKIVKDPLHSALRDPYRVSDVALSSVGILMKRCQHQRVVRNEAPLALHQRSPCIANPT